MIEQIILNAIIISLYTTGLYIATDDNMILNGVKNWLDKKLSFVSRFDGEVIHAKIYNPLIGCPYCMTSFHGAYIFAFLNFRNENFVSCETFFIYLISFTCATGLNSITVSQYNK